MVLQQLLEQTPIPTLFMRTVSHLLTGETVVTLYTCVGDTISRDLSSVTKLCHDHPEQVNNQAGM